MTDPTRLPQLTWIRGRLPDADPAAPWIEYAFAPTGDAVHLRESRAPETVVTTTRANWDAFVLGVQAGEFDHFTELG